MAAQSQRDRSVFLGFSPSFLPSPDTSTLLPCSLFLQKGLSRIYVAKGTPTRTKTSPAASRERETIPQHHTHHLSLREIRHNSALQHLAVRGGFHAPASPPTIKKWGPTTKKRHNVAQPTTYLHHHRQREGNEGREDRPLSHIIDKSQRGHTIRMDSAVRRAAALAAFTQPTRRTTGLDE